MFSFTFKKVGKDEWNNDFVVCPVCHWEFKADGIAKHIRRMVNLNDQDHLNWAKKHEQTK